MGLTPLWGTVRVHLVPATHPPNFSPITAIGKKLIFYRFIPTEIQQKYIVRMRGSDMNFRCAKHLSGGQ